MRYVILESVGYTVRPGRGSIATIHEEQRVARGTVDAVSRKVALEKAAERFPAIQPDKLRAVEA